MYIKLYLIALPAFLLLDAVWLGLVAKGFYRDQIGYLMRAEISWSAAIVLYLLLVAGLVFFAVAPAIEKGAWTYALAYGAFFGFITYATYDLTNLATIRDWPLLMTIIDIAWGTAISAIVSVVAYALAG